MQHFNRLTPAEAERLAMLAEGCGEVVQAVTKILRHGYESHHPDSPDTTNRDLLTREVTDLYAVIVMMEMDFDPTGRDLDEALRRKHKYAHHQQ